jgi:2-octaprenyl-6-methoxyphenol hydroxylase
MMKADQTSHQSATPGVPSHEADVVIVGGGLVGLTLASALAPAGLSVVVVDREAPVVAADEAYDGRGSAIAFGSARVLDGIGLWSRLRDEAEPILDIRVSDGDSTLFLHYDHREVGADPLGYIVENRSTRRALYAHLATLDGVRLIAPAAVVGLKVGPGFATARLADGGVVRARLAIAADGRGSPTRAMAGIKAMQWRYPQTGIVCSIRHQRPHRGIAHERFLPAGPFAVLPLKTIDGVHRSSLVWTERADLAPAMMQLSDTAFSAEIARRFGDTLGTIAVEGGRWAYPLGLLQAERYVGARLALVGDAAHAIHPIAGQGLNLGLRDVAALAEAIVDAHRLGLDIGAADVLERYQRWRRFDNFVLMAVTDGLNRLFSNDVAPIRLARDLGLAMVDRLPPLKSLFMRHAMGLVGDLPRLVRGEAL